MAIRWICNPQRLVRILSYEYDQTIGNTMVALLYSHTLLSVKIESGKTIKKICYLIHQENQ